MAYEIFEQLDGRLPDAIVYPAGGGTGLIGMWKAFDEMESLGWLGPERPRMFAVQASGCAPLVKSWREGSTAYGSPWPEPETYASGLKVPAAVGDFLMLRAIRESDGAAIAVDDAEMTRWVRLMGRDTGVFAAPEGAATAAALQILLDRGLLDRDSEVVLFNTGSGLKYVGAAPS
jgi:threonine synthase